MQVLLHIHFSDVLQQYNEKAGFKAPLANISCCMYLLRCELSPASFYGISAHGREGRVRHSLLP